MDHALTYFILYSTCFVSVAMLVFTRDIDVRSDEMPWNIAMCQVWATVELNLSLISGRRPPIAREIERWLIQVNPLQLVSRYFGQYSNERTNGSTRFGTKNASLSCAITAPWTTATHRPGR